MKNSMLMIVVGSKPFGGWRSHQSNRFDDKKALWKECFFNKTVSLFVGYFPTQNLLSDAEVTICKYKSLIISVYSSNYGGGQILCRGTEEGRKIYKNLQMKLPSKIKYTNICKDVFPVLCIFTFVNTYFCRFLQSLKMVWKSNLQF